MVQKDKDQLGMRMKSYERTSQLFLKRKLPVIGRIDGKAFHTLTRGLKRPYDDRMQACMMDTAYKLMSEIENCTFIYSQSDEISLFLRDYDHIDKGAWFAYNTQKLCSVSAAISSTVFTDSFRYRIGDCDKGWFDSRFFNISEFGEVANYFIWRQYDCIRNSINSYYVELFGHKAADGVNMRDRLEGLKERGFDWIREAPTVNKLGFCVYKKQDPGADHAKIYIDTEIPRFTVNREYVERFVYLRDLPDLSTGGSSG